MKNIIIILDPVRTDSYYYLNDNSLVNNYYLLWKDDRNESSYRISEFKFNFKKELFWGDFKSPSDIIKQICPDKIIFIEMIDLRQIALMVYANLSNIATIYLEHGAAGNSESAFYRWNNEYLWENKFSYYFLKLKNLKKIILAKWFYYSIFFKLRNIKSMLKYGLLPIRMIVYKSNMMALYHTKFKERTPSIALSFNEVNFKQIQLYTGLENSKAILTGVPFFDIYYKNNYNEKDYIVYIEHPYLEENLLNWDQLHHEKIASNLFQLAENINKKLYIKLHPASDINLWTNYKYNKNLVEIIQNGDYTELYLESKLIIGYSSSLLNGLLCAKKNIVNIGWHPIAKIFGVDFSLTGLCHKSLNIEDLFNKFDFWYNTNLANKDEDKYNNFLKEYNFPFDGKATERIEKVIND